MTREQCVICIDNSERMRNGDYAPTRMEAQIDSSNVICGAKTQVNAESTVALMTMAGSSPAVKLGLTDDFGKMVATLTSLEVQGEVQFATSMRVAKLVLKRFSQEGTPNRRIVAFVGSPLKETKEELQKLGAELKKSNVAVDVINFGEEEVNTEKLEAFIEAIKKDDNSHLVTVPSGPHVLSDVLLRSPIIRGAGYGDREGGEGEEEGDPFADIAQMDPELAAVMRQSLEEYNQQQQREGEGGSGAAAAAAAASGTTTAPAATSTQVQQQHDEDIEMDEDEELRLALEMSRQESLQQSEAPAPSATVTAEDDDDGDVDMDEDEQLRLAMELSKQETGQSTSQTEQQRQQQQVQQKDENINDILQDADYLDSVLESLPGVNKEDLKKQQQQKKKDDEKE